MRRCDRTQKTRPRAIPQSHTLSNTTGHKCATGTAADGNATGAAISNGCPICAAKTGIRTDPATGAARQWKLAPTPASHANGIRNFTDAASQIQYRTAARFFRSVSVNSHATAANKVDCQR